MRLPSLARNPAPLALGGLALGALLGWAGRSFDASAIQLLATSLEPLGTIWLNALRMAVLPLIISRLLAILIPENDTSDVLRSGRRAAMLFFSYLAVTAILTAIASTQLLHWFAPSLDVVESFKSAKLSQAASAIEPLTFADWAKSIVPQNPFDAAAKGNIMQILVFTVAFGLAAGRLPQEPRATLSRTASAAAQAMMVLVAWIMKLTPVGVFVLMLNMMLKFGSSTLELIVLYVTLLCALLIVAIFMLYPITALLGRISLRTFARAVAPAQLVAASTQSSIAALPALIKGAEDRLGASRQTTDFALTLAVSTFKMNQAISPMFKFILLTTVFGIPQGPRELAVFGVAIILLSFGVAGIPRGNGGSSSLPFYLAVGVPIEGFVLLEAVKSIPDVFMTTLNVTADMSVATIMTRSERDEAAAMVGGTGGRTWSTDTVAEVR
ncbi:dicarboxylate/amino acid:cation symporter [Gemmatimonas sp.]|jgi:Na+/H+-dicarboxylate symporter|uniref:dicarboxylate/amino acid:cation symporter n=1 Tax=Gemmatimonas sp. TaxID=1962908 RepID=UPI0037C09F47